MHFWVNCPCTRVLAWQDIKCQDMLLHRILQWRFCMPPWSSVLHRMYLFILFSPLSIRSHSKSTQWVSVVFFFLFFSPHFFHFDYPSLTRAHINFFYAPTLHYIHFSYRSLITMTQITTHLHVCKLALIFQCCPQGKSPLPSLPLAHPTQGHQEEDPPNPLLSPRSESNPHLMIKRKW